jgi:hypothetical protein
MTAAGIAALICVPAPGADGRLAGALRELLG